jgi:hypothetical protein
MISVLIRVEHGVEALAVTLGALVPAVAEGLIADAVVLAPAPDETLASVAEAVGAIFLVSPDMSWREGAAVAKRDWYLCLADGDVLTEGWIRSLERFVALSPPERRFGRLGRRPRTLPERIRRVAGTILSPHTVRAGDLVHRSLWSDQDRAHRPVRVAASIERDPAFG